MKAIHNTLRRYAAMLVGTIAVITIYGFARLPAMPDSERTQLASHFHFKKLSMPEIPGSQYKYVREVHPSLRRISAWISSVGAGRHRSNAQHQVEILQRRTKAVAVVERRFRGIVTLSAIL